ncbi:MAG: hypothetical protein NTW67_02420, partial [Candidatus Woesearchaeota archaeon]|nr:hypothetical protein [Candidatus Woesearchaeota archaeon]
TPINLKLAFDPDNQNNVTNDDSNLTFVFSGGKIRSDGGWDTTFDDSGVYPIAVEISDGEVTVNKTVTLTISNVNRPPLITAPDLIYAVGYADLSQYIVELDNQNTATNDDNELTIRYTAPFDSAGKWMPSVAGVASTTISVFDGDNTVEKFVTVILENVSQPFTQTPPVPVNDTFTAPNETAPVIDTIVPVNDTVIIPVNDTQVEIEPVTPENETEPAPQPVVTNNTIVENVTVSTGLTDVVVLPVTDENATNVITNTTQNTTQQTAQNITQPQNTTQTSQNATQQTDTFETTTYSIPFIPLSQPIVPVEGLGVEVFVNSKKVSESDSVKVKPGKEVKVKVELENRDNVSKDVSVSAEVGDLDEDGKDSFILLPGARDEFKLIFEIPRLTDDDNYPLKVLVNDKETKEWNVVLKVDKPAHELSIRYFSIDPIVCGQVSTELKVRVENTGKNDEEGVLELVGESVGLSEKISFELEQGESKAFTRTVSAPEGSHEVSARVVYGKKSVLSKTSFTSSVCKAEQAVSTQSEPGKERFAFLSQQKANIVAESAPVEDIFSFVFLTVLTVFALLLFVFIVPPLFRG